MRVLHADAVGRTSGVLAKISELAVTTCESRRTLAVISAHVVDAFATVGARCGQTLVEIELAVLTLETRRTVTDVTAVIIEADAVVQARIRQALVDVNLAIGALVAEEESRSQRLCNLIIQFRLS